MLLQPRRTKYRKSQKGTIKPLLLATRGIFTIYGNYALIAKEAGRIDGKQIESARIAITRKIRKYGKLLIRIFPNIPVTKKPTEVRMGQGKGAVDRWICRIKPSRILFEISSNVPNTVATLALNSAAHKLPILTKIIKLNPNHSF